MSERKLEERVSALENQLAELTTVVTNATSSKNWRKTLGIFTGDDVMKRIDEATLKVREDDRKRARRRQKRTVRAKK